MSVEPHESARQRFPLSLIILPRTAEDFRRSVIDLSLYSAAGGIALFAYLMIPFWHAPSASVGIVGVALLTSAILMILSSTGLWIKLKWLKKFGRIELAGVATVLLSLNVGTHGSLLAAFFNTKEFATLSILILSGAVFWAIVSLRFLVRARDFADRTYEPSNP
jgi:hypothetical protein